MHIRNEGQSVPKLSIYEYFFCVLTAIAAFLKMSPYFTWNAGNLLSIIYNVGFSSIAIALGLIICKNKVRTEMLLSAAFIFLFGFYVCISGGYSLSSSVTNLVMYALISIFILLRKEVKIQTFKYFYKIFALSLLPAIIVFIFQFFGGNLPYNIIQPINALKASYGHFYIQYFGSVFYSTGLNNSYFCGMMDEPGLIGTFSGLFLVARMMVSNLKNKKNKISIFDLLLFTGGLFSQSKAFLFILIFAFILKLAMMKNFKGMIGIVFVIILGIIFLNIKTDYEPLVKIQSIIYQYEQTHTLQLFRTTDSFEEEFNMFLNGDIGKVFFGNGYMSSQHVVAFFGSAEIRMLIYDIGFVGVTLLFIWLVLSTISQNSNKHKLVPSVLIFLFAFLLSMIQRQYVTTLDYIVILFGGSTYVSNCIIQNYKTITEGV